jgi:TfoX/Sxy family transcriptional regulator of competence genes
MSTVWPACGDANECFELVTQTVQPNPVGAARALDRQAAGGPAYDPDMAYDESLANRIRDILRARDDVSERKMFGGLAFMVGGHMACGVLGPDMIVRIGPDDHDEALTRPGVRTWDFTGRPTRGMVYVGPEGVSTAAELERWTAQGLAFAATRPSKAS